MIRELGLGPKRFTDLVTGLPGIGPTLLAKRLNDMQAAGLVTRTKLPPPAAANVYELTQAGSDLAPALVELARWGLRYMDMPKSSDHFRLGWYLTALQVMHRPESSRGVRETYELRIADELFTVRSEDGALKIKQGPSLDPDLVLTTDYKTFFALGRRRLSPSEAASVGRAEIEGDLAAADRCVAILRPGFRDAAVSQD